VLLGFPPCGRCGVLSHVSLTLRTHAVAHANMRAHPHHAYTVSRFFGGKKVNNRDVILLTGVSGAGKTTLFIKVPAVLSVLVCAPSQSHLSLLLGLSCLCCTHLSRSSALLSSSTLSSLFSSHDTRAYIHTSRVTHTHTLIYIYIYIYIHTYNTHTQNTWSQTHTTYLQKHQQCSTPTVPHTNNTHTLTNAHQRTQPYISTHSTENWKQQTSKPLTTFSELPFLLPFFTLAQRRYHRAVRSISAREHCAFLPLG
jgi:hypothetical protein